MIAPDVRPDGASCAPSGTVPVALADAPPDDTGADAQLASAAGAVREGVGGFLAAAYAARC